jgi:hypothetical protein
MFLIRQQHERKRSMAADKKNYESVLGALVDHANLASTINKLNKVLITTQDPDLRKLISPVVSRVEKELRDLPNDKKSLKGSFRQALKDEPYKSIVDYCQKCISSTKPQWQIIAERHGWGPKTK